MPTLFRSRTVGRPRIDVSFEYIEFLRGLRFSFTEISSLLGIRRATLYRRLGEVGVNHLSTYTEISDTDLDLEVVQIKASHPNDGERLMIGHLTHRGIIVPRSRLRGSIHRVDPDGTEGQLVTILDISPLVFQRNLLQLTPFNSLVRISGPFVSKAMATTHFLLTRVTASRTLAIVSA